MSIEIERSLDRMARAMEELTDAIHAMTVTNQALIEVLLDAEDPDARPLRDMEGNPV